MTRLADCRAANYTNTAADGPEVLKTVSVSVAAGLLLLLLRLLRLLFRPLLLLPCGPPLLTVLLLLAEPTAGVNPDTTSLRRVVKLDTDAGSKVIWLKGSNGSAVEPAAGCDRSAIDWLDINSQFKKPWGLLNALLRCAPSVSKLRPTSTSGAANT